MYFFKQCVANVPSCLLGHNRGREIINGDLICTGNRNQGINTNYFIIIIIMITTNWLIPWFPNCVLTCPRAPLLWTGTGAVRNFNFLREAGIHSICEWRTRGMALLSLGWCIFAKLGFFAAAVTKSKHCKNQGGTGTQVVVVNLTVRLEKFYCPHWASLVAQTVKNPPAMQEIWVRSLGWGDPLEEAWPPTPGFLPGESPWTEEPGGRVAELDTTDST